MIIENDESDDEVGRPNMPPIVYTEGDLEAALKPKLRGDELLYTNIGIDIAEDAGFFKDNKADHPSVSVGGQFDHIHVGQQESGSPSSTIHAHSRIRIHSEQEPRPNNEECVCRHQAHSSTK